MYRCRQLVLSVVTPLLIGCSYELDDLKHSCEALLETHIDEDSVCCLLSIAEQYNARKLKVSTTNATFLEAPL